MAFNPSAGGVLCASCRLPGSARPAVETVQALGALLSGDWDTVGGLVLRHLGRVPKRNEVVEIEGLRFQVLRADSRRLYTLLVDPSGLNKEARGHQV